MRFDPAIAALRSDPAPQRQAQAAIHAAWNEWASSPAVQLPLAQLAAYGDGRDLVELQGLTAVMTDPDVGKRFVADLVDTFCAALRSQPLGLVPLRHQTSHSHIVLELSRAGQAALSLMVYRPVTKPEPQMVCFTSGERREICLQGEGEALLIELSGATGKQARLITAAARIGGGWTASFDNAREGKIVTAVSRPLVILRLQRDLPAPQPVREYRLADGSLMHVSAAERADSRRELALALLGSMGRTDAKPVIAEAVRRGPDHVRWEAVRQTLALDSAAGVLALSRIARDPTDPLSAAASALRAQLLKTYPQLRQIEERATCLV